MKAYTTAMTWGKLVGEEWGYGKEGREIELYIE